MMDPIVRKNIALLDLILQAGYRRKSARTGMVHGFPLEDMCLETIPLYENFCFVWALFRKKTAESITEGKVLLEKLLPFQTKEGNFPQFIHEYPQCWDRSMALKIAPFFVHLLEQFGSVCSSELRAKLQSSLDAMISFSQQQHAQDPYPYLFEERLLVLRKQTTSICVPADFSAQEWFEWMVNMQLVGPQSVACIIPYHAGLQLFVGKGMTQDKEEPSIHAIEWALNESLHIASTPRLLQDPLHVLHVAALTYLYLDGYASSFKMGGREEEPYLLYHEETFAVFWKGSTIHSLNLPRADRIHYEPHRVLLEFHLDQAAQSVFDFACFCDLSPENTIWVNEDRATVFYMSDKIVIRSSSLEIRLSFTCPEGALTQSKASFVGHILRGNRPSQRSSTRNYEVYDWLIGLRKLRSQGVSRLHVSLEVAVV
jgi:hypothetical protein